MRTQILYTLLFCSMAGWLNGQSISNQVVASGGQYSSANGNSLEYTVGEAAVTTLSGNTYLLTQGFHQPYPGISGIPEDPYANLQVTLYPNPSADQVNILFEGKNIPALTGMLFDAQGKALGGELVFTGGTENASLLLDIRGLSSGSYYLAILTGQRWIHTLRFEKINP